MSNGDPTLLGGKLRVLGVLGAGGMGKVLSAFHVGLGVRVAVKITRDGAGSRAPELTARLLREGRAASSLRSPHVARVMDVGTLDDGALYVVMEHVDGETLADIVRRRGPLPVEEAVDWTLQICEALAEAHGHAIVHRDLKPANLMLTEGPDGAALVKVLDFGAARTLGAEDQPALTGSMVLLGSPRYMSPEQIRDARTVDARSDLWSLGITLYELLTGSVPFDGHTTPGVLAQIAADEPAAPITLRGDLPAALCALLLACLEKDPARRPRDVSALAASLSAFASTEGKRSAQRVPRIAAHARVELDRTLVDGNPLGAAQHAPSAVPGVTAGQSTSGPPRGSSESAADKNPTAASLALDAPSSTRASADPSLATARRAGSSGVIVLVAIASALVLVGVRMRSPGPGGAAAAQASTSATMPSASLPSASAEAAPPGAEGASSLRSTDAVSAPTVRSRVASTGADPAPPKLAVPSRASPSPRTAPKKQTPVLDEDLGPRQ